MYSQVAEWFVYFSLSFVLIESIFWHYLESHVTDRSVWWARLTPWHLYPSEVCFLLLFSVPGLIVVVRGRPPGHRTARGIILWGTYLAVGTLQALHGYIIGGRGNLWLADYRQLFLCCAIAPPFFVLGARVRLAVVASRLYRTGVVLAGYSAIMGVLLFAGVISRESPWAPGQWSEQVLLLLYSLALSKSVMFGQAGVFSLTIYAIGILAPLNKTPVAGFVVLNLILLYIFLSWRRRKERTVAGRALRIVLVVTVVLVSAAPWFFTLGDGAAVKWLSYRWLKEGGAHADVTSGRLDLWRWGFEQWMLRPVTGHGLGLRMEAQTRDGDSRALHVHNLMIALLYLTGIMGFLTCVTVFGVWAFRVKALLKSGVPPGVLWPVVGMFAYCMTVVAASLAGNSIGIPYVAFSFWMCVGLVSSVEASYVLSRQRSNGQNCQAIAGGAG